MTPDINVLVAVSRSDHPNHSITREWLEEAIEACEAGALRRLCLDGALSGNAIPDAWIAAAVKVMNGRLVTLDRGFTRLLSKSELLLLRR
jgi:predicted nucleic acid-binding protein